MSGCALRYLAYISPEDIILNDLKKKKTHQHVSEMVCKTTLCSLPRTEL